MIPLPPDHVCTVRGAAVTSTLEYVSRTFGLSSLQNIVKEIGVPYKDVLDLDFLLGEPSADDVAVPVGFLVDLMQLVGTRYLADEGGPAAFAERLGANGAYVSQPVLRRIVINLMSPDALMSKAADVWGHYYNCGTCRAWSTGPHQGRLTVEGFHAAHPIWCRRLTGYIRELLRRSSGRRTRVTEVQCAALGAPRCEWAGDWSGA